MNCTSRENVVKIKEYLEDIYMYLNNNIISSSNNIESENHEDRNELKRKELIENCKHIQSIFEMEFHPHDDTVDSTSYLDMNGTNKCSTSDENEIDNSRADYIEMRKRKSTNSQKSENPYNIYEATISLSKQDYDKCPFTGLPAVHLKLMCSPMTGLLTRLNRKYFFGQSKDFYVGILDKWMLLYPSKSNDMKPAEYFYPKTLNKVKGENQFVIVTSSDKRYHFLAPNSQEYNEWILNINRIIDDMKEGKVKDASIPQLLTRKLPSPPTDKRKSDVEIYYSFGGSITKSINSNEERLYEEPCSASLASDDDKKETPPKLPAKKGKKISDEVHGYDTPKPTKVLLDEQVTSPEHNNTRDETQDYDIPPRVKVSEMTAILSGINLVSPEEKRKSSKAASRKSSEMTEVVDIEKKEASEAAAVESKSPVKRWFRKRIMRGKRFSLKDKKSDVIVEEDEDDEDNDELTRTTTTMNEEAFGSVKGSKVNMIINQLEKSGQLKALKKGLKSRKTLSFDTTESIYVKN